MNWSDIPSQHPRTLHVANLESSDYDPSADREATIDPDKADVISSLMWDTQVGDGAQHFPVLDLDIPGMSGVELTHRLRSLQALRGWTCPIVAISARAMPLDRLRCLEAGMDDYLTKPLEPERLRGVLQLVSRARR